jgi:DNA polymerase-3 subunit chi
MTEITFYLLSARTEQDRYLFACKLIEKAWRLQQATYLYTQNTEQSELLDNLLWTFRAGSFVPHDIYYTNQLPEIRQTVLIGTQAAPTDWQKILINVSPDLPPYSDQTDKVLEILENDDAVRQAGRQRYRQYKEQGLHITTHHI